jgi:hypothetical protein
MAVLLFCHPTAGCCSCRYISALLLSVSTMLHLELPQINVLSKVDLVKQYGEMGAESD